jgi:hypothetical protein
MKKVVLSALAATIVTSAVYAESMTLFSDPKTGQVFTTAGEGRVEMGDFVDAKTVDMGNREQASALSEYQDNMKKYTNVTSKAKKLEFSGTHYFGLTSNTYGAQNSHGSDQSTGFEFRRNYVQVKAYFNDKDYFRVTTDTTKELEAASSVLQSTTGAGTTAKADGPMNTFVKYAYLWLDNVLPYTGVEIGMTHRAWIDYEENDAWFYRSINKVNLEDQVNAMNSADLGINFRTSMPYFSSEFALFNGEGYHSATNQDRNNGLSFEWRTTAHLMGNGEHVGHYHLDKDVFANISFAGMSSQNNAEDALNNDINATSRYNRNAMWLHAVYNQPEFLIAAQYNVMKDHYATTFNQDKEIKSFSINGEYRPATDWTVLGRFDDIKTNYTDITASSTDKNAYDVGDYTQWIYGVAYNYNKNVKFIASGKTVNSKDKTLASTLGNTNDTTVGNQNDKQSWMMTTEVTW